MPPLTEPDSFDVYALPLDYSDVLDLRDYRIERALDRFGQDLPKDQKSSFFLNRLRTKLCHGKLLQSDLEWSLLGPREDQPDIQDLAGRLLASLDCDLKENALDTMSFEFTVQPRDACGKERPYNCGNLVGGFWHGGPDILHVEEAGGAWRFGWLLRRYIDRLAKVAKGLAEHPAAFEWEKAGLMAYSEFLLKAESNDVFVYTYTGYVGC